MDVDWNCSTQLLLILKIKNRVWIPYERPEIVILQLIELLSQECINNDIDLP